MSRLPEVQNNGGVALLGEAMVEPTHVVGVIPAYIEVGPREPTRFITDPDLLEPVLTDEARFPGGNTPGMFVFHSGEGANEVASVMRDQVKDHSVVVIGAQTSLTGAAVPTGEVILDLSKRKEQSEIVRNDKENYITVQSGVTLRELQDNLRSDRLFLPSAPTYPEATVIGAISTDAAGARSYKYGKTRNFVEALRVVLPTGEVLEMNRGQYLAHDGDAVSPGGYFEIDGLNGTRRVPIPTYTMPDVPKVSAGYYAKPGMDLIDLFVGSEGTLGVITEATIRVMEEPSTYMALIPCQSDEQALELNKLLRNQEPEKRQTLEPGGISAVEYIGSNAVELVRQKGKHNVVDPLF